MTSPSPAAHEVDVSRLSDWLDSQALPGAGEPATARTIAGGSQNAMFLVERPGLACVLRMPPIGAPSERDTGVLREWRVLSALTGSGVPHARAVALCEDPAILGRPFYVTDYVRGFNPYSPDGWPAPFDLDLDARRGLAHALIDGVVAMGGLDWRARGLAGLGRPEGFHDRQVPRWTGFPRPDPGARAARLRGGSRLARHAASDRLRARPDAR